MQVILSGLAGTLLAGGQREEALALLREAHERHPADFWINYLLGHFWEQERPQEAVGYFRERGYREDATDDFARIIISPHATAGFPQLYVLDPDRHVIEVNSEFLD